MKEIEALSQGAHIENGLACVMEAAAYIAGEKWSDNPECVSQVITRFMSNWNDALPGDEARTQLLAPLIKDILGTRGSNESETKRSWMVLDWLVRECVPAFMDLTLDLQPHAKTLRDLGPICDEATCKAAMPMLNEARKAAVAAKAAAGAAARAAAGAAGASAWGAAKDAAGDGLAPTVSALQESAQALVRRMAEVERAEMKPMRAMRIGEYVHE